MSVTISYKRFGLIPVTVNWFNTEPDLKGVSFRGVHIFKQSVPLSHTGNAVCVEQTTQTTSIIDLIQTKEQIWKGMSSKSCRPRIRRIEQMMDEGADIHVADNADVDKYIELANDYIREKGYAKPLKLRLLQTYMEIGAGDLVNIYQNKELMAGNFYVLDHPWRVRSLFSFNKRFIDKPSQKLYGALMRYLHWYAIQKYKAQGFRWYDTGGVNLNKDSSTYGIAQFKLSLGGTLRQEYNYSFVSNRWLAKCYETYHRMQSRR